RIARILDRREKLVERHVGSSRVVVGPKTVGSSIVQDAGDAAPNLLRCRMLGCPDLRQHLVDLAYPDLADGGIAGVGVDVVTEAGRPLLLGVVALVEVLALLAHHRKVGAALAASVAAATLASMR